MSERLPAAVAEDFTWRDGERLIRFAGGAAAEASARVAGLGVEGYERLGGESGRERAAALGDAATALRIVAPGRVDDLAGELLDHGPAGPFVAFGGGRVIDVAKSLAGATGSRCAALPTTLSGAEMTPFHRRPAGRADAAMARPALVVADPELMAGGPAQRCAASAMNALAHAMEALYTPLRGPVTDDAALRAAGLLSAGVRDGEAGALALGALLAGYASGATGIAVHHALCQSVVRAAGAPHAETNAVVLAHSARFAAGRAPEPMARLARALGGNDAAETIASLSARSGYTRLAELGVEEHHLDEAARTAAEHPGLVLTPGGAPSPDELRSLLAAAH